MEIKLKEITVRDIANGYVDNQEEGVFGYEGKLNIRPPYQREYVYKDDKRNAVIDTIVNDYPLNVMYWAKNDDGTYEVLDGQQRTISFCEYVDSKFSINEKYFHNLTETEKEKILNYKLMVYICEGNDKERLDWFRTINIAGEKLTDQELLNINYTGPWLSHAKKLFSKTGCNAIKIQDKFLLVNGSSIRQEVLETALSWITGGKDKIAQYMAENQHKDNAYELWTHFNNVVNWVKMIFPNYRKEMKGIDWGKLYTEYKDEIYNIEEVEKQISELMSDEEVTSKKGVYEYVLSRGKKERLLSVRAFSEKDKRTVYERQEGRCSKCGEKKDINEMHGDHIVEWSKGGRTVVENLQMVCHKCHKELTNTLFD